MYLKQLSILTNSGDPIREVKFHKGLNIILGERSGEDGSTNSIGKTTLLRSLDFCLGGDEKGFFQDKENKEAFDHNVFNFFYHLEPRFRLEVTTNLNSKIANVTLFERHITGVTVKNQEKLKIFNFINGNEVSSDEYTLSLKEVFFKFNNNKPSFRQLIPKFIRKDDQQINYILRFLHQTTSDLDYEVIHFLLFGYPNPIEIEKKFQLAKEIKQKKADIKVFDRNKPAGLDQVITLTKKELDDLTQQRDLFKIDENYKEEEDNLNVIQNKIKKLDENISTIEFELNSLQDRAKILENKEFDKSTEAISLIYKEANLYNIELKNKFEETVNFHNKMLHNELAYINNRIIQLIEENTLLKTQRINFAKDYSTTLEQLAKYGSLAEYTKLNNQISDVQSKLGNAIALHQKTVELTEQLTELENEFTALCNTFEANLVSLQDRISIFNEYFSKFCKSLFNQAYYLSADANEKGIHKFRINSLDQNFGSGKKSSLVVAFDLAYAAFIQDSRVMLPYPRFSTQDKIEIIDIQELYGLASIASNSNGQLIFPIIGDKFSGLLDFEHNVIVKVSKHDRFFRIEKFLPSSLYMHAS